LKEPVLPQIPAKEKTMSADKFENLMDKSYKYLARMPSAFCTLDYAIFILNFLIYHAADLSDVKFCIDYIDSFMMFAGLILFFSAKHSITYYSSCFFKFI
jgi:hypothetical protein